MKRWKLRKVGSILEVQIYLPRPGNLRNLVFLFLQILIMLRCRGNKVVTDRATKKPKIVIRNWECGIVCSAEKLGFGSDSWNVLKRFMFVDGAAPINTNSEDAGTSTSPEGPRNRNAFKRSSPRASKTCVPGSTTIFDVLEISSIKYFDMVAARPPPRTSMVTFRA